MKNNVHSKCQIAEHAEHGTWFIVFSLEDSVVYTLATAYLLGQVYLLLQRWPQFWMLRFNPRQKSQIKVGGSLESLLGFSEGQFSQLVELTQDHPAGRFITDNMQTDVSYNWNKDRTQSCNGNQLHACTAWLQFKRSRSHITSCERHYIWNNRPEGGLQISWKYDVPHRSSAQPDRKSAKVTTTMQLKNTLFQILGLSVDRGASFKLLVLVYIPVYQQNNNVFYAIKLSSHWKKIFRRFCFIYYTDALKWKRAVQHKYFTYRSLCMIRSSPDTSKWSQLLPSSAQKDSHSVTIRLLTIGKVGGLVIWEVKYFIDNGISEHCTN